jgi:hypothetical protein
MKITRMITLLLLLAIIPLHFPALEEEDANGSAKAMEPVSLIRKQSTANAELKKLAYKSFKWFQHYRNPDTGLVLDRSSNWKDTEKRNTMASIASTGYFLTLLPVWVRLGWISESAARKEALQTLRYAWKSLPTHNGLFYHFMDWKTGRRWGDCEVSVLDSAIFLNGCMTVAEGFRGGIARVANELVNRADWPRFLVSSGNGQVLALAWSPEDGLFGRADVRSSEMSMPYLLAIGSESHPIPKDIWYHMRTDYGSLEGYRILNPGFPLFTSYFGLGWCDLKNMQDKEGVDLYENARLTALANRAACRALATRWRTFQQNEGGWWGISAGDSPKGYVAAAPPNGDGDGTVWPMSALADVTWIPDIIDKDLARWMSSRNWEAVNGAYGLAPFSLDKNWVGDDIIGIDLGGFSVNWANYTTGFVWKLWGEHPTARKAMKRIGFTSDSKEKWQRANKGFSALAGTEK